MPPEASGTLRVPGMIQWLLSLMTEAEIGEQEKKEKNN